MKKSCLIILLLLNAFIGFSQNNALLLTGTDHIEVPNNDSFDLNNITIEARINIAAMNATGGNMICSKGECGVGDYSYYFSVLQGKLVWTWYQSGDCSNGIRNTVTSNNIVIAEDSCIHVAVAHSTSGVTLYVDGQAVSSTLTGTSGGGAYSSIKNSASPLRIGTYYTSGGSIVASLNGSIADFRIWNTTRSQSLIQQKMNTQLYGSEANLALYFTLQTGPSGDGALVSNQATSTGMVNNGTMSGSTVTTPLFTAACPYYISVDNNSTIDITEDLTIETWVTIPLLKTSGMHTICTKGWCGTGDYGYYLAVVDGFLVWTWYTSGDCSTGIRNTIISTVPFVENTCVHVAVVHTATGVTLYMDGQAVGYTISGNYSAIQSSTAPLLLGVYRSVASGYVVPLDGRLTDFRMWNSARSQAEIVAKMNSQLVGNESDLVVYFPLQTGSGTVTVANTATNTGVVNNGTINGSLITPTFLLPCVEPFLHSKSATPKTTTTSHLSELKKANSLISPNPFTGETILMLEGYDFKMGSLELVVYDNLGRIISNQNNIKTSSITVDGTAFEAGIYFYQLSNDKEIISVGKLHKVQ